jgi:DNA polymerase III epsilon subunit-like protein
VIVFDTETTGLIQHPSTPLERQPEIIEFCGVKLSDIDLTPVGEPLVFLVKPRTPALDPKITQITGMTLDDLKDAKPWSAHLPRLEQFFTGEHTCVAHNCSYDIGMMTLEQQRLNRVNRFPWPVNQICTVDATRSIKGHRLKLGELYEYLFGEPMGVAHRAEVDVMNLVRCVQELRNRSLI